MAPKFVPERVKTVMQVVCILLGLGPKVTTDPRRARLARRGATGAAAGTTVDWWHTSRAVLLDAGFISKLRYYNKQQVGDDIVAKVAEVAGDPLGQGIAYDEYSLAQERARARAALTGDPAIAEERRLAREAKIADWVEKGMDADDAVAKADQQEADEARAMAEKDEKEGGGYLLVEAMSKWTRAILAYRQAALEHAEYEQK